MRFWAITATVASPFAYAMVAALGQIPSRWIVLKVVRAIFMLGFIVWPFFALNVIGIAIYLFIIRRTDVLWGRAATATFALVAVLASYLIFHFDPLDLMDW